MSALHVVCAAVAASVLIGFGLVVAGVAVLAGAGWALVAAGGLLSVAAVASGFVLLREPAKAAE